MNKRRVIKKIAETVPVSKSYLKYRKIKSDYYLQEEKITGLNEAVKRLEDRNDEWAAEVRSLRGDSNSLPIIWPVKQKDIVEADWTKTRSVNTQPKKPPFTITWVVPPMGPVSGGHADIFRTIAYLESRGHICNVYFYDPLNNSSLEMIRDNLQTYTKIKSKLFYNSEHIPDSDILFATNWHTAYPVFNYKGSTRKYYYVQDFEPFFEPVGTYYTLAENTYKFGLKGITLGNWLTTKLSQEFGMNCDYFDLGVNTKEYYLINTKPRNKIFFYARPVTPRRGFELGVLALSIFQKEHPEYEIIFVGWDISPYKIPFKYKNLGIQTPTALNKLYNECAAGLVISFTNMSLLPLEMLAAGCRPVMNLAEHTKSVSYAKELVYSEPSPQMLADNLYRALKDSNESKIKSMSDFTKQYEWDDSNKKIEEILLEDFKSR